MMMDTRTFVHFALLFFTISVIDGASGEDYLPQAQDVTWSSYNFKTILTWGPNPTNYSYTVEFSRLGMDKQTTPHCIRSAETECDLTNELGDLNATYSADVLSEPLRGVTSDLPEFPYTPAKRFCPYRDTQIGRPEFKIGVSEDKMKATLYIQDPLTAVFGDGAPLNIREIFGKDLKYKIKYTKAGSTGKKEEVSDRSQVELSVDQGESYCFSVAAFVPSRSAEKRVGEWSRLQCSQSSPGPYIFQEYGLLVIAGALLVVVILLIVTIVLIATCCKRIRRAAEAKESDTDMCPVTV